MLSSPGLEMFILGVSAFYHDSAACLLEDGRIVAAAQEERFTRKRHDAAFPRLAAEACLRQAGIASRELAAVAYYEKPFLKLERLLETHLAFAPRGLFAFLQALPRWLGKKLWIPDVIARELAYDGPVLFAEHHEAHAASAFFPSPFEQAAFLTLDGVGEWTTASYGVGRGNRLTILAEQRFPDSLGLLYAAFTYLAGFKPNSGEYKVMGLAPYGEPRFVETIYEHLVDLRPDGSFRLNLDYFDFCVGLRMTNERCHALFGPPRVRESPLTQREMDLARSIQVVTEEIVMRMARHVRRETGERALCLAGGVALNCVANGRLQRERVFDSIWIQPAAGDAGGAIGAAYVAHHHHFGSPSLPRGPRDGQQGSLLGPAYDAAAISTCLDELGARYEIVPDDALLDRVAAAIAGGSVVGWFQGRMEFGPRALGARSILADARSPTMQATLNASIKLRETFRPFAPSVLADHVADWFELSDESPYMLLVADVKASRRRALSAEEEARRGLDRLGVARSAIPAVTHVDGSARVQTVHALDNPLYHALLTRFHGLTGCPVLVNTSFNVRGEPIVESPRDAYRCFMRTDIDLLVVGSCVLEKASQPPFVDDVAWQQTHVLD